jgi:hypothetical protein
VCVCVCSRLLPCNIYQAPLKCNMLPWSQVRDLLDLFISLPCPSPLPPRTLSLPQVGDLLLELHGRKVNSYESLTEALRSPAPASYSLSAPPSPQPLSPSLPQGQLVHISNTSPSPVHCTALSSAKGASAVIAKVRRKSGGEEILTLAPANGNHAGRPVIRGAKGAVGSGKSGVLGGGGGEKDLRSRFWEGVLGQLGGGGAGGDGDSGMLESSVAADELTVQMNRMWRDIKMALP